MKIIFLIFTFIVVSASQANACYTIKEFEAEQAIRIHSELMVIGLTCLKMPNGVETYNKYKEFTHKNSELIAGYEADLINYYSREGIANPKKKLDKLRTNLANKISEKAIRMSILSFCQKFSSRVGEALNMSEDDIRNWARDISEDSSASELICNKSE